MVTGWKLSLGKALALTLLLGLLYPWESTTAPLARIQVLDEAGHPAPHVLVKQEWQDVLVEESKNAEYLYTDGQGHVTFPRRSVRAPFVQRIFKVILGVLTQGFHASLFSYAHITAYSNKDAHVWEWSDYRKNGNKWPGQVRLCWHETPIHPVY